MATPTGIDCVTAMTPVMSLPTGRVLLRWHASPNFQAQGFPGHLGRRYPRYLGQAIPTALDLTPACGPRLAGNLAPDTQAVGRFTATSNLPPGDQAGFPEATI
jgi:hypothetical protein